MGRVAECVKLHNQPMVLRGASFDRIARDLARESTNPDAASELILEGLCLELFGTMGRVAQKPDVRPPKWLLEAKNLIHYRYAENLKISEIADELGVHPVYLSSAFRRHFGVGAGDYLRNVRLGHARRQLERSDCSIAEVSAACGFYDQSHFTRTFRSAVGKTPQEYRIRTKD